MKRIIIGITGATGTIFGWRLMELLRSEGNTEIHLVMSQSAKLTLKMEHDVEPSTLSDLAHEAMAPRSVFERPILGIGSRTEVEMMLTMRPIPASSMAGTTICVIR